MDEFPICCNCQTRFSLKGPPPFLLSCLHSVCETCVVFVAGGTISCSTCNRQFDLSKTTLPKDIVRQREIFQLTVKHQPSQILCTHEQDGNQAVGWCLDCEELLCEHCQNLHESFKSLRKHTVQQIGETSMLCLEQDRFCPIHKKYVQDIYDTDCQTLICLRCKQEGHEQHNIEDVDKAYDSAKLKLEKSIDTVVKLLEETHKTIDHIGQELRQTDDTRSTLTETVSLTFSTLSNQLDQRQKEVQLDLEHQTDTNRVNLTRQRSVFGAVRANTSATLDYFRKTLEYSTKCDLLTLAGPLGDLSLSCEAAADVHEEKVPTVVFSTHGLQNLRERICKFGRVSTDICSEDTLYRDQSTQTSTLYVGPHLQYDEELMNTTVYINTDGDLTNSFSKSLSKPEGKATKQRYRSYSGTLLPGYNALRCTTDSDTTRGQALTMRGPELTTRYPEWITRKEKKKKKKFCYHALDD